MKLYNFSDRHIGPRNSDVQQMIEKIGITSINQLIEETVPSQIMLNRDMDLPEAMSEIRFSEHMKSISQKNKIYRSYIGMGYYNTILPAVIHRNILENPGWYTSYTAYQAEISQGRLEALLNFQTMVSDLTAMDLANASLLDEGTSAAEAMIMLFNTRTRPQKKEGVKKFFVSELCFPQTIDLLKTRSEPLEIELVIGNHENIEIDNTFYGVILQYPAKYGVAIDYSDFTKKVKAMDISVIVAADLLSLSLLTPPGEWGWYHTKIWDTTRLWRSPCSLFCNFRKI